MVSYVSHDAIVAARRTPLLYDFLLAEHPNDVVLEGDSLRLINNHSVSIKRGHAGFTDFSTGETGNPLDCLIRHFGYSFLDAATAFCEFVGIPTDLQSNSIDLLALGGKAAPGQTGAVPATTTGRPQAAPQAPPRVFAPPVPFQGPYRQLFAYLTQQRGIPASLVQKLIDDGLLYQEAGHNNIVFIDQARTYAELRGTVPGISFHGMAPGSDTTGFWWFKPGGPGSVVSGAFICEAAIDAISLHLVRQRLSLPLGDNPMYCSIGGVANQQRIDVIKAAMAAAGKPTVLAVDNDDAGERCRQNNLDCYTLVPRLKDWNEDLLATRKAG